MTQNDKPWQASRRTVLSYLGLALLMLATCFARGKAASVTGAYFSDAKVYAKAITVLHAGGNPYLVENHLPFVYPPFFLKFISLLSHIFPANLGWFLYLFAATAAALVVPWLLAAFYIRSAWLTPVVAMVLFAVLPRLLAERELITGNIADLLYVTILSAGILGIQRNKWLLLYLAIIVAALVKPPFLTLLLLPLFAGRRQIWQSLASVVALSAIYSSQRFAFPVLYADFKDALYILIVNQDSVGYGLYTYLLKVTHKVLPAHDRTAATLGHFAIMGLLCLGLFLLRKRKDRPDVAPLWVPALVVLAVLANPRMMWYDAVIGIIPAIYICVECIRRLSDERRIGSLALALTLLATVMSWNPMAGICFVYLLAVILTIVRLYGYLPLAPAIIPAQEQLSQPA